MRAESGREAEGSLLPWHSLEQKDSDFLGCLTAQQQLCRKAVCPASQPRFYFPLRLPALQAKGELAAWRRRGFVEWGKSCLTPVTKDRFGAAQHTALKQLVSRQQKAFAFSFSGRNQPIFSPQNCVAPSNDAKSGFPSLAPCGCPFLASTGSSISKKRWRHSQSRAPQALPCPATSCPQCTPCAQRLLSPGPLPAGQPGHQLPGLAGTCPQAGKFQLHPRLAPGSPMWDGVCRCCGEDNKYQLLPQVSGRQIPQFGGSSTVPTCGLGLRHSECLRMGARPHTWHPATEHPSHWLCQSLLLPGPASRTNSITCAK